MILNSEALERLKKIAKTKQFQVQLKFSLQDLQNLIDRIKMVPNQAGHVDPKFDEYPNPTGVTFAIGKMNYQNFTIEVLPMVGMFKDENDRTGEWDFIINNNQYGYTDEGGLGPAGQQNPPPPSPWPQ